MEYIQLDNFNGSLNIICKDDGSGEPLIFETLKEAQDSLEDNCQNGQIIPLGENLIDLFDECEQALSDLILEGMEDDIKDITDRLDEILGLKL